MGDKKDHDDDDDSGADNGEIPLISAKPQSQNDRWYTNKEVASILLSAQQHPEWFTDENVPTPPSGSVLLFDREKVKFRRDGYAWKKRKDGRTKREDHAKLKIGGVNMIYGCYAHSEDASDGKATNEASNIHRRCYWLLEAPRLVLVHYLNTEALTSVRSGSVGGASKPVAGGANTVSSSSGVKLERQRHHSSTSHSHRNRHRDDGRNHHHHHHHDDVIGASDEFDSTPAHAGYARSNLSHHTHSTDLSAMALLEETFPNVLTVGEESLNATDDNTDAILNGLLGPVDPVPEIVFPSIPSPGGGTSANNFDSSVHGWGNSQFPGLLTPQENLLIPFETSQFEEQLKHRETQLRLEQEHQEREIRQLQDHLHHQSLQHHQQQQQFSSGTSSGYASATSSMRDPVSSISSNSSTGSTATGGRLKKPGRPGSAGSTRSSSSRPNSAGSSRARPGSGGRQRSSSLEHQNYASGGVGKKKYGRGTGTPTLPRKTSDSHLHHPYGDGLEIKTERDRPPRLQKNKKYHKRKDSAGRRKEVFHGCYSSHHTTPDVSEAEGGPEDEFLDMHDGISTSAVVSNKSMEKVVLSSHTNNNNTDSGDTEKMVEETEKMVEEYGLRDPRTPTAAIPDMNDLVSILEYCPRQAEVDKQTQVLIIGPWYDQGTTYHCNFGNVAVEARLIQSGVLSCTVRSQEIKEVSLIVYGNGVTLSKPVTFKFIATSGSEPPSQQQQPMEQEGGNEPVTSLSSPSLRDNFLTSERFAAMNLQEEDGNKEQDNDKQPMPMSPDINKLPEEEERRNQTTGKNIAMIPVDALSSPSPSMSSSISAESEETKTTSDVAQIKSLVKDLKRLSTPTASPPSIATKQKIVVKKVSAH